MTTSGNRRRALHFLGAATLAAIPLLGQMRPVRAASTGRLLRVGVIFWGPEEYSSVYFAPHFLGALSELGYAPGKNLELEWRYSDGDTARDARLATELGAARLDALVTAGSERTAIVSRELRSTPLIVHLDDPVARGFAKSLSRPGGNVTGVTVEVERTAEKQFELLRRLMPKLSHVAILIEAVTQVPQNRAAPVIRAARRLGLSTELKLVEGLAQFEEAFRTLKPRGARAAYVLNFRPSTDARKLNALAVKHQVATTSLHRVFVEQGGLMAYFANNAEVGRRMAALLGKVLQGSNPAVVPFEQPTRFDLVINRKTAREIGLEIPGGVLLQADQVIG